MFPIIRKGLAVAVLGAMLGGTLGLGQADAAGPSSEALKPMRVSASGIAPESRDARGRRTTFVAANAADGRLDTAWRVSGDGRGAWLQVEYPQPVQVSEVRIAPGYVKIDRASGEDRFRQNRTIKRVRLEFSAGQTLEADLSNAPKMQSIAVPGIETAWIRIHPIETRAPAARVKRNFTAVSELEVRGRIAPAPRQTAELRDAQMTLTSFFRLLHDGRYEQAGPLYGGNLDDLSGFIQPETPRDAASVLRDACQILVCVPAKRIAWSQQITPGEFYFGVEFAGRDGTSSFVRGPCCGATEAEMPTQSVFYYTVKLRDGRLRVMEPPVYVP